MKKTYHHSKKLDFLDLVFEDRGEVISLRLFAEKNELSWHHSEWEWDPRVRQCVPLDWSLKATSDKYTFEAKGQMPLKSHQAPFLSTLTLGTKAFFIQEQYPEIQGSIRNKETGELVATFSDQGGGEFALAKSMFEKTSEDCVQFGKRFRWPR
jgi:hypothetical protein